MMNKIRKNAIYLKLRHLIKSAEQKKLLKERIAMYEKFCKKGDLVIDVGANIGNRVEAFLALKTKVVAVEPQKFCRKVLKAKFGNKIEIVKKGLGEKEEVKTMFIASTSSQISSFSKDWIDSMKKERFAKEEWDQTEQIELTTLERMIEKFGLPTFIKIDVEGFELEVLKGLQTPVAALSFEYAVPEQLSKALACLEKLNSISSNYTFNYSIAEAMNLELTDFYSFDEMKAFMNSASFLATSNGDIYARLKK